MKSYFLKFFLFNSLIWILQFSYNWKSCILWNYKSKLENTSFLLTKRSLSESQKVPDEIGEGTSKPLGDATKFNNQEETTKVQTQLSVQQGHSEDQIEVITQQEGNKSDVELESGVRRTITIENFFQRILPILKNHAGTIYLSFFILISLISFVLCLKSFSSEGSALYTTSTLLTAISLVFTLLYLLNDRIHLF